MRWRELAEYLGHYDAAFTLRVYTHLRPTSPRPRPPRDRREERSICRCLSTRR
jgi:hypothetical protein